MSYEIFGDVGQRMDEIRVTLNRIERLMAQHEFENEAEMRAEKVKLQAEYNDLVGRMARERKEVAA